MSADDPFGLQRFVDAQSSGYRDALAEITAGAKRSHWMWFVFPQLKALGRSSTAQHYGMTSLNEAKAYLAHPVLGQRLHEITLAARDAPATSLQALFGSPDDLKFKSSMTLFEKATGDPNSIFAQALDRWCSGVRDKATLDLLAAD
jgi:uncharacterized protein (DUF1810 family)